MGIFDDLVSLMCRLSGGHVWGWHFEGFPEFGVVSESVRCVRCGAPCRFWVPGEPLPYPSEELA